MTTETKGSLLGSLEFFESFGERFVRGLSARLEGEITLASAEILRASRASLTQEAKGGALLGRTAWAAESKECSGCFLWIGELNGLTRGAPKTVTELSDEEVSALDQSLRLNIEEGGEDDLALEWSPLERLAPQRVEDALREAGISVECELCRVGIQIQGQRMLFLFFSGGQETPTETETALASAARAERQSDPAGARPSAPRAKEPQAPPSARAPGSPELANLEHLLTVRIPLTIRLGSTRMKLDEVLRLTPGSIVELDQREDEPLEVLANGRLIAKGEVVVVDERFGLRITEIGSSAERLQATL